MEYEIIAGVVGPILAFVWYAANRYQRKFEQSEKEKIARTERKTLDEMFQEQLYAHVKAKTENQIIPPLQETTSQAKPTGMVLDRHVKTGPAPAPKAQSDAQQTPQPTMPTHMEATQSGGGARFSMPAMPDMTSASPQRKRAVNEGELEAAAQSEARIEALEIQTGVRLEDEPSDSRVAARKHPRYKVFFEEACSELRARYAPGKVERATFEGHELPPRAAWLAALDAQIRRACLDDANCDLERTLRTTRHTLAAIYEGLREFGEQADIHAVTRLADDYLPVTIDVFEAARAAAVDDEGKDAAERLFRDQVKNLCARYAPLGERIMRAAARRQATNGRFIKEIAS